MVGTNKRSCDGTKPVRRYRAATNKIVTENKIDIRIDGTFKTKSSKQIHLAGNAVFEWQRLFHGYIIRSSESYERIDAYITQNPGKWDDDQFNKPEKQKFWFVSAVLLTSLNLLVFP
ncbi:hypothetical protein [Gaoshiqia sp. Z1-71]|uniref:hypothetical protein n=1 Tax=Gaoshiqia hydrogeniformans TaxID=3290090 RepID=UPI003BF85F48